MAGTRALKVAAELRRELTLVVQRELHDPRLAGMYVTGVTVSADLRHARIFVALPPGRDSAAALNGLRQASGFMRRTLASRLRLRYMPELLFTLDTLPERAARLDELIARGLNRGPADRPADWAADSYTGMAADIPVAESARFLPVLAVIAQTVQPYR